MFQHKNSDRIYPMTTVTKNIYLYAVFSKGGAVRLTAYDFECVPSPDKKLIAAKSVDFDIDNIDTVLSAISLGKLEEMRDQVRAKMAEDINKIDASIAEIIRNGRVEVQQ